ncbi:hypothetical protein HMPREF1861_00471 [Corynebacterium kroppenstedtii]|nr:hypothetical protein HMPREF1861_00471 [Corynebacterium kroppenstedtii]
MADQCSHLGTVQFSAVFAQEARRGFDVKVPASDKSCASFPVGC